MQDRMKFRLLGATIIAALIAVAVPVLYYHTNDTSFGALHERMQAAPDSPVITVDIPAGHIIESNQTLPASGFEAAPTTDSSVSRADMKSASSDATRQFVTQALASTSLNNHYSAAKTEPPVDQVTSIKHGAVDSAAQGLMKHARVSVTPPVPSPTVSSLMRLASRVQTQPSVMQTAVAKNQSQSNVTTQGLNVSGIAQASHTVAVNDLMNSSHSHWAIQVGVFSNSLHAQGLQQKLKSAGYQVFNKQIKLHNHAGILTQVFVGPESTKIAATQMLQALRQNYSIHAFIKRI